jgi:hypothetical protein
MRLLSTRKRDRVFFRMAEVTPINSYSRLDFLAWGGKTRSLDLERVLRFYYRASSQFWTGVFNLLGGGIFEFLKIIDKSRGQTAVALHEILPVGP